MAASYPTKVMLGMQSGNLCAFPDCRQELMSEGQTSEPAIIGEAAHIYGEHDGNGKGPAAARYRQDMTDEERNHLDNLIYLCPTCHTKIDKQEADYPAEALIKIKADHQAWVKAQLDESMSEITFAELDLASRAIAAGGHYQADDMSVIPPADKIEKNDLTNSVSALIATGLSQSSAVSRFLSESAKLDEGFPERLASGFKEKYLSLKQELSGDELFMAMLEFAQQGNGDFTHKAAALAILSHLFHICEVFEK